MTETISESQNTNSDLLVLTIRLVSAYIEHNALNASDLPALVRTIHQTLAELVVDQAEALRPDPAVEISKSITDSHIICLEDGAKLKMLKRYLKTHYDLSPDAYRARWGLPADYPMVAPEYARRRSEFAKQIGLGKTARRPVT